MGFTELFCTYINILIKDFLRYFLFASPAFLIFWVLAKSKLEHRFIQKQFPKAEKLWFEFRYSIITSFIFALNGLGVVTLKKMGFTQIYTDFESYGLLYFFISLAVALFLHDTYFYWTHRLMHHKKIFKYVHKIHHNSTNPSPWAAYSFHPIEAIIQSLSFTFIIFLIPLHPIALFIFLIFMIVRNVAGHLGFELFPKGFTTNRLFNWNTTTTHHNLHHSKFNFNYGLYFTFWDEFMNTTSPDYQEVFEEVTSRKSLVSVESVEKQERT